MRYFIVAYRDIDGTGLLELQQEQYPNLADIKRESAEESAIPVSIMELSESDWLDWNRDETKGE